MTPSTTTSGADPSEVATTGVPHAIDSIITSPKGSGHWMEKTVARARPRRSTFSAWETFSRISSSPDRRGTTICSQ